MCFAVGHPNVTTFDKHFNQVSSYSLSRAGKSDPILQIYHSCRKGYKTSPLDHSTTFRKNILQVLLHWDSANIGLLHWIEEVLKISKCSPCSTCLCKSQSTTNKLLGHLVIKCALMLENQSFLILTNESIFKNSEEIRIEMTFDGSRRQQNKGEVFYMDFFFFFVISHHIPLSSYLASVSYFSNQLVIPSSSIQNLLIIRNKLLVCHFSGQSRTLTWKNYHNWKPY